MAQHRCDGHLEADGGKGKRGSGGGAPQWAVTSNEAREEEGDAEGGGGSKGEEWLKKAGLDLNLHIVLGQLLVQQDFRWVC